MKIDRLSEGIAGMEWFDKRLSELIFFTVGRQWTFSSRLYQRAAVNFPIEVHCNWTGVGNASFDHRQVYHEEGHSTTNAVAAAAAAEATVDYEPLATCLTRVVHVDPVIRKPASLPEFFTNIARKLIIPDGERFPSLRPPIEIPDHSYRCRVTVRYDDTDWNSHTNGSSYLGFVLECASNAAKVGYYSTIDDDIAFYRAKQVTSIFVSQSRAGDELDVSTWEDVNNTMLLNFIVSKDGKMICFARIEYYDNSIFQPSYV